MAWAFVFNDTHVAVENHRCSKCRKPIWAGEEYERSAVPPWGYECQDEDGNLIRYSVGEWVVLKVCNDCL